VPVLGDKVLGDKVLGDKVLGDKVLGDKVLARRSWPQDLAAMSRPQFRK
jgi:hypothetical protein